MFLYQTTTSTNLHLEDKWKAAANWATIHETIQGVHISKYPTPIDEGMEEHGPKHKTIIKWFAKDHNQLYERKFRSTFNRYFLFLKRKIPVNLCYLITNLRPSRLPLGTDVHFQCCMYPPPDSPVHLVHPGLTQTSSYVASPFPQCWSTSLRLQPMRRTFFFPPLLPR